MLSAFSSRRLIRRSRTAASFRPFADCVLSGESLVALVFLVLTLTIGLGVPRLLLGGNGRVTWRHMDERGIPSRKR